MDQPLNNPLSGEEIIEIIVTRIAEAVRHTLTRDQRLLPYFAFPSFTYHADITIALDGQVPTDFTREVKGSTVTGPIAPATPPEGTEPASQIVTVHDEQEAMPPNAARVENGLGVPVLAKDNHGRFVEKKVKYGKKHIAGQEQDPNSFE